MNQGVGQCQCTSLINDGVHRIARNFVGNKSTVGDFGRNIVRTDMQSITVAGSDGNMIEGIDFCIGMNAATVDCGSRVNIDGQVAERKGLTQKIDGIPFFCGRRIVYAAVDLDGTARSAVNDVTEARGGVDDEVFACVDDQSSAFAEF